MQRSSDRTGAHAARAAPGAIAVLLLAGCAAQGEVHVRAEAVNHTGAPAILLLKVWDHTGALVLNATLDLPPGQGLPAGTVAGPSATYGSRYSWFAHSQGLQHQEERAPGGVASWTVHLHGDRIEFAFAPA